MFAVADGFSVLLGDQFLGQQPAERGLQRRRVNGGEVILQLLAHEHAVRADTQDFVRHHVRREIAEELFPKVEGEKKEEKKSAPKARVGKK